MAMSGRASAGDMPGGMTGDLPPARAGQPGPVTGRAGSSLRGQHRWIDLDGPLHYLDFGGNPAGPVIVCVHGLGGSAVNWLAIAPLLTGHARLYAPDLPGHGLTRSGGRPSDVHSGRSLLHRFVQAVPGAPVIAMGNSMGGMISLLEAGASPASVTGLILIDPALPLMPGHLDPAVVSLFALMATPGLGRLVMTRRRRMAPETAVGRVLALCVADPGRVRADVVAEHVALARRRADFPEVQRDFAAAARSVARMAGVRDGGRYRRVMRSVTCPVLLLHGARDRLVPVAAARAAARAHPAWSVVVLGGVGHVPQLEVPGQSARLIADWLASSGLAAPGGSRPA